jgi:predicted RNase H-like HicB family nuclease
VSERQDGPAAVRLSLRNEFTAIVEQDGPWFIAYCAEVHGANGQGKKHDECLTNLREAIALVLEHRREESLRAASDAIREVLVVG